MDVPLLAWVCYGAAIWLHEVEMTNDQIIELAKQADILSWWESGNEDSSEFFMLLQRFAELVRNQTLEEAAEACERLPLKSAKDCAEVIRLVIRLEKS